MHRPIPDSYWVDDGLLLAGEYPGSVQPANARQMLGALLDAGIRAFVDLTEEGELRPYDGMLKQLAAGREMAVAYDRVPIRDLAVLPPADLAALLSRLQRNVSDNIPSYVHCWGGIGRTGTVIGCWLVEHGGLDGAQALTRMADLRRGIPDGDRRSPETDEQRAMVLAWADLRQNVLNYVPVGDGR